MKLNFMQTKKIVLSLFVVLSSVAFVNAQKGSWYLGGNLGLSGTQDKYKPDGGIISSGNKITTWSVSPEVGTFLTNHIQLGIGFTFTGNKQTSSAVTSNATYYGGTLYGRYFFGKPSSTFKPFIGLNIKELPGTNKSTDGGIPIKANLNDFGVNLNAGFAVPLSSKVTAVGSFGLLGFENSVSKDAGGNKTITNTFGLDAGTLGDRFSVGIYFTL